MTPSSIRVVSVAMGGDVWAYHFSSGRSAEELAQEGKAKGYIAIGADYQVRVGREGGSVRSDTAASLNWDYIISIV